MNEKSLYYSMLFYFLQQSNLRLEKKEENSAWFRDENNTIFVLERNEFPWKRQYIERTQKFITELLEKYGGKIQPREVIRMTFTTRVPYEYTDLKDIVRFKNGQMRHYIISEKISKEKYEEIGPEIFGLKDQNKYISDTEEIEEEFQHIPVQETIQPAVKEERKFFLAKRTIVNPALIIVIVLSFFLWQKMNEDNIIQLIDAGAKFNPLIQAGEWWRLFTPVLLHGSLMHLGMNMLSMYYIGNEVERFYGKWRYLFIFIFSAAGGSIASFAFSNEVSVGASGAIFGLFGALLYICQYYKEFISPAYRRNMFILVAFNLVFGAVVPGIDLMAHIGGFIIGFLVGYALNFPRNLITWKRSVMGIAVLVLLSGFYVFGDIMNDKDADNTWKAGNYYLEKKDYESAYPLFQQSIEQGKEETEEVNFIIGYTEVQLGKYEESVLSFQKVVQMNDRNEDAYYNLALIFEGLSRYDEALQNIQKALALHPKNQIYLDLQERLIQRQGGNQLQGVSL